VKYTADNSLIIKKNIFHWLYFRFYWYFIINAPCRVRFIRVRVNLGHVGVRKVRVRSRLGLADEGVPSDFLPQCTILA
jgi:hypothetical protein